MTALFRKIDCLSLPVTDLDAALAFYSAKLGHEIIWRSRTAAGLQHVPAGTSRRGRAVCSQRAAVGARCG